MTDLLPNLLWISFCFALWVSAARDPVTIALCGAITIPYTVFLIRDFWNAALVEWFAK